MNDRAKYKGRMAIYAMAGVYLLAQSYYMYKDCLLYTSPSPRD